MLIKIITLIMILMMMKCSSLKNKCKKEITSYVQIYNQWSTIIKYAQYVTAFAICYARLRKFSANKILWACFSINHIDYRKHFLIYL